MCQSKQDIKISSLYNNPIFIWDVYKRFGVPIFSNLKARVETWNCKIDESIKLDDCSEKLSIYTSFEAFDKLKEISGNDMIVNVGNGTIIINDVTNLIGFLYTDKGTVLMFSALSGVGQYRYILRGKRVLVDVKNRDYAQGDMLYVQSEVHPGVKTNFTEVGVKGFNGTFTAKIEANMTKFEDFLEDTAFFFQDSKVINVTLTEDSFPKTHFDIKPTIKFDTATTGEIISKYTELDLGDVPSETVIAFSDSIRFGNGNGTTIGLVIHPEKKCFD